MDEVNPNLYDRAHISERVRDRKPLYLVRALTLVAFASVWSRPTEVNQSELVQKSVRPMVGPLYLDFWSTASGRMGWFE